MMKRMLAIATAIVLALALVGCQSEPTQQKDPAEVVAAINKEFLEANVDQLPALMELDAETLQQMYGIEPEWVTDYVCQFPMMNVQATEIFVAHVAEGHMEEVKAALAARQETLENTWELYLPDQYELVRNSVTEIRGDYVLYAVTEHAGSLREIFERETK